MLKEKRVSTAYFIPMRICGNSPLLLGQSQLLAAQQVVVEMENNLSGIHTAVVQQAISAFRNAQQLGNLAGCLVNLYDQLPIFFLYLMQGCDMLFGDDQHMHRRRRLNIVKGDHMLIFINNVAGKLPVYDFTENAIHLPFLLNVKCVYVPVYQIYHSQFGLKRKEDRFAPEERRSP